MASKVIKSKLPRGLRNNNPGNIERTSERWQGMASEQTDPRFVQFETMAYGYRALFRVLRTYIIKHQLETIPSIIGRYAPPNENRTRAYVNALLTELGVTAEYRVSPTDEAVMKALARAITRVENGTTASEKDIAEGWRLYLQSVIR